MDFLARIEPEIYTCKIDGIKGSVHMLPLSIAQAEQLSNKVTDEDFTVSDVAGLMCELLCDEKGKRAIQDVEAFKAKAGIKLMNKILSEIFIANGMNEEAAEIAEKN